MPSVDIDALNRGIAAALVNAERLIRDGRLLVANGSHPTAHSLAVLAMEEAAKAYQWDMRNEDATGGTVEIVRKHHGEKLTLVRRMLAYMAVIENMVLDEHYQAPADAEWRTELAALVQSDNAAKQRGFYVDVDGDRVLEPGLITAEAAEQALNLAAYVGGMVRALIEDRGASAPMPDGSGTENAIGDTTAE